VEGGEGGVAVAIAQDKEEDDGVAARGGLSGRGGG
jgi:hypothetical protein